MNAAQIVDALIANTEALYADRCSFETFRAENARLWRLAEANPVVREEVCAHLRNQEAA